MNTRGQVMAVCISDVRGIQKTDVGTAVIKEGYGIDGDAHGGDWHRQISLLSWDRVQEFNQRGAGVGSGDFGENIVVAGIDLKELPVGTRLKLGGAMLEVTQIGKECHKHCQIYHRMGDCIMPREGIFAKVLSGGAVAAGDDVEVLLEAPVL